MMKSKYIVEIEGNDIKIKSNNMVFSTFKNGEQTSFRAYDIKHDNIVDRANDYCIFIYENFLGLDKLFHKDD